MPAHSEENISTILYCRTTEDGVVTPEWDELREAELKGHFEVGLTVADRYFLTQRLGDGATGRVFLAKDLRLDRPVAMKVISHPPLGHSDELESRLEREAKLGASLNHKG